MKSIEAAASSWIHTKATEQSNAFVKCVQIIKFVDSNVSSASYRTSYIYTRGEHVPFHPLIIAVTYQMIMWNNNKWATRGAQQKLPLFGNKNCQYRGCATQWANSIDVIASELCEWAGFHGILFIRFVWNQLTKYMLGFRSFCCTFPIASIQTATLLTRAQSV